MPSIQRPIESAQAFMGVANERQREVLARIEARRVQADELRTFIEQGPGSGGEVLKPRAHGDDEVRLATEGVGTIRTGHADGSKVERIRMQQRRHASDRLDDGHLVSRRKFGQRLGRRGVMYAAAGDDDRSLRALYSRGRRLYFFRVGTHPADAMHASLKKGFRVVVGNTLD